MLGGIKHMSRLSFFELAKVFGAGFLGYALLVTCLSVGTALFFPSYLTGGWLDMSIHEFFRTMFDYFGLFGLLATPMMLIGAWCILRLFRR